METWEGWAGSRGGDGDWENGLGVKVEMGTGGRWAGSKGDGDWGRGGVGVKVEMGTGLRLLSNWYPETLICKQKSQLSLSFLLSKHTRNHSF